MLNSSYGKLCEGFHDDVTKIINDDEIMDYMFNNYNVIKEAKKFGDKYLVK